MRFRTKYVAIHLWDEYILSSPSAVSIIVTFFTMSVALMSDSVRVDEAQQSTIATDLSLITFTDSSSETGRAIAARALASLSALDDRLDSIKNSSPLFQSISVLESLIVS